MSILLSQALQDGLSESLDHKSSHGGTRNRYKMLVPKLRGYRPLGRSIQIQEDKIKIEKQVMRMRSASKQCPTTGS
jgi:hypothetical protein